MHGQLNVKKDKVVFRLCVSVLFPSQNADAFSKTHCISVIIQMFQHRSPSLLYYSHCLQRFYSYCLLRMAVALNTYVISHCCITIS